MNVPNKLTLIRMILVPVFMAVMLVNTPVTSWIGLVIFIVASLTDFFDGKIARKNNIVTNFGKFMDPLADKLLVTAALIIFVEWGQMPSWAAMIIIAREFAVTGLRLVAASAGVVLAAGWSGKIKTASSMVAICLMITPLHSWGIGGITIDTVGIFVMVATTLWSGIEYFVKNGKLIASDL